MGKLYSILDRLRGSYWFIPSMMALAASALSMTLLRFDQDRQYEFLRDQGWIYTGGAEGARAVLSTIAGSIITVAGTTFSITIASLSLASAQFGPRLLRNFMRDTGNQVVLGTFTSTFLYCLLVLRTIRGLDERTYVPHLSVSVAVALAILSLGVLIYFIHHVAESIQVSHLIQAVGNELDNSVKRLFPERLGEPAAEAADRSEPKGEPILAPRGGYVQTVDATTLWRAAEEHKVRLTIASRPGDYIIAGQIVAFAWPDINDNLSSIVLNAFTLGSTRNPHQDAVFAFLQLAEVAVRALSPGINDPFTAIMCIDRITSGMSHLLNRSLPQPQRRDSNGEVRVIANPYSYEEMVEAAYGHIRAAAANQWQVRRHLQHKLRFLVERAHDPAFLLALRRELE